MRPYSNDLRTRVVQAYEKQEGSQRALARRFGLSLSCVHELLKRFRQTGRVDPKPHGGGYPPKITEAARAGLRRLVEQFPMPPWPNCARSFSGGIGSPSVNGRSAAWCDRKP